jgi:xylulokinase
VCAPPKTARTVDPDPALVPAFQEAHARYRKLYPAIKGALK